jgi:hypothetical protein
VRRSRDTPRTEAGASWAPASARLRSPDTQSLRAGDSSTVVDVDVATIPPR